MNKSNIRYKHGKANLIMLKIDVDSDDVIICKHNKLRYYINFGVHNYNFIDNIY